MPVGALGFQTVLNTGKETVWGTAVTTDRSYEIVPGSTPARKNKVLVRQGMRGGSIAGYTEARRVVTGQTVEGTHTLEVLPVSMGRIFEQLMGAAPVLTQVGVTPAWSHLYALGSVKTKSLTLQSVFKDPDLATITTLTQAGCKFTSGEFSLSADQMLQLAVEVDGKSEVKNVVAAASAYASATVDPFHFAQATLTVGGATVANLSNVTAKINRPLKVDRFYIGSGGLKDEQTEEERPSVSGSFTADVTNEALYDLFVADGGGTMIWQFVGGPVTGAPASNNTLTITVPLIHLTEGSPQASATGLLAGQYPWESTAGAATITYLTSDTAA